jgi:hypothetical protein
MERTDVVILVNSTPKYYYILEFFFGRQNVLFLLGNPHMIKRR